MSNVTPATTDYSRQREMTMNPLRAVPSSPADNTPVDEVTNYEILPQQLLKSLLQGTAISLFLAIVLFFIRGSFTLKDMAIALIYWAVIIGGYGLLRLDKLVWLSHGFIAFFWLSLTIFMIFYGSDRMPNPGIYRSHFALCGAAPGTGSRCIHSHLHYLRRVNRCGCQIGLHPLICT